ncbi:MAG: ATP-binding cassette domain-containing protein [Ktedonobacteraceae bacterium]|nr:ATP-binding cassette domain-containing protein [Chloroflexota bacterium]
MVKIAFQEVTKQYPGSNIPAVDAVTFDVQEGSICMLLGTSGSGKTTLLRMVNRLIEPTSGKILIDGHNILQEDPIALRRRIGYVIQQVGLFPHMNIAENIRVTAQITGWSKPRMAERVDELLRLVDMDPAQYRARFPRQLSGGQQQRIGLARALTIDPAILLMDEPFGALDAITRERMQGELLRIQRGVRKTILFVTHDVEEAFRIGDQIAVMSEGKLVQIGTPIEILLHPANEFVNKLVGADSMLRQLQYLPVSSAMEPAENGALARQEYAHCSSSDPLLQALLRLIETNTPALDVYDEHTQEHIGYVSLASINREITSARSFEKSTREETKIESSL